MAFYTSAQSFGAISLEGLDKPKFADQVTQDALKALGIDYYVHYSKPGDPPLDLGSSNAEVVDSITSKGIGCENKRAAPAVECKITVVLVK